MQNPKVAISQVSDFWAFPVALNPPHTHIHIHLILYEVHTQLLALSTDVSLAAHEIIILSPPLLPALLLQSIRIFKFFLPHLSLPSISTAHEPPSLFAHCESRWTNMFALQETQAHSRSVGAKLGLQASRHSLFKSLLIQRTHTHGW